MTVDPNRPRRAQGARGTFSLPTSRTLVAIALVVFLALSVAPLLAMAVRVTPEDLNQLVEPRVLLLLLRTVLLGLCTALVAVLLGLPFGFLVARTDAPLARVLRPLGILPLLLPPLFLAMTWSVFLPDTSELSAELRPWFGMAAAVCMLGLSTFPLVAIFSARAFERIDGRFEEAARLTGGLGAVLRMELPLVWPAVLTGAALAFAFAVNDFAVPDYVSSVGPKFGVYADEIKLNWDQFQRPGKAVTTAVPLIAITLAGLIPAMGLRRRGAMAALGSDFRGGDRLALGPYRWPACAFLLFVVALGCGVPLGRMVWEAAGMPRHMSEVGLGESLSRGVSTLSSEFGTALELARADLANSLTFAVVAAALAVPIGLVLGHRIERARSRTEGRALEITSLLPIAAPAVLFGIGVVALWNHDLTAEVYDGKLMPILLFLGRYGGFAVLVIAGGVASLDPSLEEAAALGGASPARRLLSVVAPALKGSLAAAFVLVFVFAMRDLDAAIIVPAANKTAIMRVFNGVHFGRDSYVFCLALLLVFAILLPGILWSLFAKKRLEVLP